MTLSNPQREPTYDLTDATVVPFTGKLMDPVTAVPVAVQAVPDALLPPKKRGRKKGSKNRKAKKSASAPAASPKSTPSAKGSVPGTEAASAVAVPGVRAKRLVASGGDGMLAGLKRAPAIAWWVLAVVVAVLAIGAALAFVLPPPSMS